MKIFTVVFITLAAFFVAAGALAYIPPSQFIIKNVASKRTGLKSVQIVSQVSGFDSSGKSDGTKFKVLTLYFPAIKLMKSRVLDSAGLELFGVEKRGEELPLSLLVLYDPNSREIFNSLRLPEPAPEPSAGVAPPAENTFLRRWNGSVAWVLGGASEKSKSETPQIWIEKDSFLPVRILVGDEDVQFTKYRYSQELAYPRTTTVATHSGTLELQEDTLEVRVNPPDKSLPTSFASGFTDAGNSSSLKGLIRKYYAGLR